MLLLVSWSPAPPAPSRRRLMAKPCCQLVAICMHLLAGMASSCWTIDMPARNSTALSQRHWYHHKFNFKPCLQCHTDCKMTLTPAEVNEQWHSLPPTKQCCIRTSDSYQTCGTWCEKDLMWDSWAWSLTSLSKAIIEPATQSACWTTGETWLNILNSWASHVGVCEF